MTVPPGEAPCTTSHTCCRLLNTLLMKAWPPAHPCGLQRVRQNHIHPLRFHTAISVFHSLALPDTSGHHQAEWTPRTSSECAAGAGDLGTVLDELTFPGVYVSLPPKQHYTHCNTTVQNCKHCPSPTHARSLLTRRSVRNFFDEHLGLLVKNEIEDLWPLRITAQDTNVADLEIACDAAVSVAEIYNKTVPE